MKAYAPTPQAFTLTFLASPARFPQTGKMLGPPPVCLQHHVETRGRTRGSLLPET